MAGIGFVLRKLTGQDDFLGVLQAYFHSAVVAVGPWMLIVISLSLISYFMGASIAIEEQNEFLSVIIYNLCFSFVLSAPVYMIAARYVADCLFRRNATPVPGILTYSLIYLVPVAFILSLAFYVLFAAMSAIFTLLSIVNFVLFCEIWFIMLYLGAIRNYRAISLSWLVGTLIAIYLGVILGERYKTTGMLLGLNIGLVFLLFALKAHILAEYPYRFVKPTQFCYYFKHYKGLFWCGFFLFSGMWVDKVIMWGTPEAVVHLNNLRTYPIYDGAMFFSYTSVIPVMALFVFSLESNFYDSYYHYLRNIETNAPYSSLEESRQSIVRKIVENGRSFLILQGCLTVVVITLAPTIYTGLNLNFTGMSIFRFGALGALFNALNLFIIIFFSYFDSQENMVGVSMFMFFSNALLTLVTIQLGFPYYGLGYCVSMILTFVIGALLFVRLLKYLHFNIFITNVVKRQKIHAAPRRSL
jgi:polysaccharide biosynthesis protein PelG